jgi:hypothetical protein
MSSQHSTVSILGRPKRIDMPVGSDRGIFDQTGEIKNAFKAPPTPTRDADCIKPRNLALRRPKDRDAASTGRALSLKDAIAAAKPQGAKKTSERVISTDSKWWENRMGMTRATAPAEKSSASDPVVWVEFLKPHVMDDWQENRHTDVDSSQEKSKIDSVRDTTAPAETMPVPEPHATVTLSKPPVLVDGHEIHDTSVDRSKEESKIDSARTTASAEPAPLFGPHTLETTFLEPKGSEDENAAFDVPFNPDADVPVPSIEEVRLSEDRAIMRHLSSAFARGGVTSDDIAREFPSL